MVIRGDFMLGAIYGDIIGSYYEVHCTKDNDFPLNKESHFTDDSVLTVAVCRAILNFPDDIKRLDIRKRAKEYAAMYRHYYSCFPGAGFGNMSAFIRAFRHITDMTPSAYQQSVRA